MGAGKSTIGRELAGRLRWSFIDLDSEIESSERMPVREIFASLGEAHFRKIEREHLVRCSSTRVAVIATGGGVFADAENRRLMDATGVCVWLQASFETIAARVPIDGTRPLFQDPAKARALFDARAELYRLAAVHVLTDNRTPEAVAEEIAGQVLQC